MELGLLNAFILGLLQGVTEFLPISSSGHLVLVEDLMGLDVAGLKSFDVMVHIGSLLAIFIYFRTDIWEMIKALMDFLTGRLKKDNPYFRLIIFIVMGTIPAVIVGLLFEDQIDAMFRSKMPVAIVMIVLALIYVLGEFVFKKKIKPKNFEQITWVNALAIGVAQAIAIIPGISRSGSTIVTGLFFGIDRKAAARFSFLLGIPAIMGAGLLTSFKVTGQEIELIGIGSLVVGFLSSFVFGYLSVSFLMNYLRKHSLLVFAGYLVILAFFVLI